MTERARFETWWTNTKSQTGWLTKPFVRDGDRYVYPNTQDAWEAWQAGWQAGHATSPLVPPPAPDPWEEQVLDAEWRKKHEAALSEARQIIATLHETCGIYEARIQALEAERASRVKDVQAIIVELRKHVSSENANTEAIPLIRDLAQAKITAMDNAAEAMRQLDAMKKGLS